MKYRVYPAYKESGVKWLSEVPEHWDIRMLRYVTHLEYGNSLANENRVNGEIQVYGSNGVVGKHNEPNTLSPSIIIGRKGSFGKINYSLKPVFAIDTTYYIDKRHTKVKLRWLYYSLQVLELDKVSQDTGVPGLSRKDAYSKYICIPEYEEQQQIATFLDKETTQIDTLIEKQQKLIELLKEKRQALISHAVTKGLNPNVPLKESGVEWLGEVPEHWEVIRIRRVLNEHKQGYYSSDSYIDNGIKLLRITDLKDYGNIDIENCPKIKSTSTLKGFLLRSGDFVFARTGGAGHFGLVKELGEEVIFASYLIRFRFSDLHSIPDFLRYTFLSDIFQTSLKLHIHGGVNQNIHAEDIKNQFISLPPTKEQRKIATFLDEQTTKIDTLIEKASQAIALLKERRTALISAAVTGKIDVRHK
jgi:type I restriction enzyme S subunit